jgi:carbamoyltransferase
MSDVYILGMSRGHNSSVCLLKNGEVVFYIEEERLSRLKHDGTPLRALELVKNYTNKLDAVAIGHTDNNLPKADWCPENVYVEFLRKHHLINYETPVHLLGNVHHKLHAASAFYNSGFDDAVAVIVDGAGTFMEANNALGVTIGLWEAETIFSCEYPTVFETLYQNLQTNHATPKQKIRNNGFDSWISDNPGIVKCYEGVTLYLGFDPIEAGKTMGLAPYGELDTRIPNFFNDIGESNRNLVTPTIPSGSIINTSNFKFLQDSTLENQKNIAYKIQIDSQEAVLKLINYAVEISGKKNVIIAGGYGLNCVANYFYLDKLPNEINLYVEPVSHDGGTSIGAAKLIHYHMYQNDIKHSQTSIYYGPEYQLDLENLKLQKDFKYTEVSYNDIAKLIRDRNIVCMFQGKSEAGPRALGNRSILFDPTVPDGKDIVNEVKRREWFRPFAGTVLAEKASDWFNLKNLKESPFMMYAVDIKEDKLGTLPAITHVDNTCRIQTVTEDQNKHYYNLIKEFEKISEVPVLFNTSFNLGGDPLVETIEDALNTLRKSDLRYLYLPELNLLMEKQ